MIYFLNGQNSYAALNKIAEFKEAFKKKNEAFLIEEADGENDEISEAMFYSFLGQGNLFAKKRLVIFKNIFSGNDNFFSILEKNAGRMSAAGDIFVFWERKTEKEIAAFFKKYAEKVQDVELLTGTKADKWLERRAKEEGLELTKEERSILIEEAGENMEWALEGELEKIKLGEQAIPQRRDMRAGAKFAAAAAPSPFVFVEKMFGPRAFFAVRELALSGQDVQRFIYVLLWKLKQRKMTGAYFEGIKTESQMRRDPKNAVEILERFVAALSK